MSVRSAQSITTEFTTRSPVTRAGIVADVPPTGVLYVNGTADAASVIVTSQTVGKYKAQVTLPTLAVGDVVSLMITATVAGVTDNAKIWEDAKDVVIDAAGLVDANMVKAGPTESGTPQTAGDIYGSVDDLPTNAELVTALGTADDMVLAAIAALNNLSVAGAATAAATALLAYNTAKVSDVPTAVQNAAQVTTDHGVGSYADTAAGAGNRDIEFTINDGINPLSAVVVIAKLNGIEFARATTDGLGQAILHLNDGTYTIIPILPGYSLSPQTLVVSISLPTNHEQTYSMSLIVVTPSDAERTTGYFTCYNNAGDVEVGVSVTCEVAETSTGVVGQAYDSTIRTETSAGNGVVQFTNLVKGVTYTFVRGSSGKRYNVTIPLTAGDTYALPSIIGLP